MFLLRTIPKWTVVVCYNTPYEVLRERYALERAHIEPRDYIDILRMFYMWFAKYYNHLIIDTLTSDIEMTQRLIRKYMLNRMSINSCP